MRPGPPLPVFICAAVPAPGSGPGETSHSAWTKIEKV
jgi:hypothetical protein